MPVAYTVKSTVPVAPYNPSELFEDVGRDNRVAKSERQCFTARQVFCSLDLAHNAKFFPFHGWCARPVEEQWS